MNRIILLLMFASLLSLGCVQRSVPQIAPAKKKVEVGEPTTIDTPPNLIVQVRTDYAKAGSSNGPLIRIAGIRSDKPQSHDKALYDALQVAQYEIMKSLQKLDPPVTAKPSLARIRSDYLKANSVRDIQPTSAVKAEWKANKLDANRVWTEIDVELTEAQVQQLRASERVSDGVRGAGIILALVAAAYGFLRLDAWSKGYLTLWLGIGAVAIVAAVVLYLLRGGVILSS